jgi:DNA-binding transcriptional ArsR family regulator
MTPPTVDPSWQPVANRVIDDAVALKAIADPLRLRILQLLSMSHDRSWSVKEVAAELAQPVTKLYHHVKLLEAANLITDVETRVVSGIVEHRYRASQRSMRFDDGLFTTPETRHDSIAQLSAMLDSTRDDLVDYLYQENADSERITLSKMSARLTDAEIHEVNETVEAMVKRFQAVRDDPDRRDLPRMSILFMINPVGHDPAS